MILVMRIEGQTDVKSNIKETLKRLKLNRKLHVVFIDEKDTIRVGMLRSVREYVSYGKVDEKTMKEIIEKRGHKSNGKYAGFCRMHPPIGGFKRSTKLQAPRGVLGFQTDVMKLVGRMI